MPQIRRTANERLQTMAVRLCSGLPLLGLFAAAIVLGPTPSRAQSSYVPQYGIDGGVFLPTDQTTKDLFGSTWFSISPAVGPIGVGSDKGKVDTDFSLLYGSRGDNKVFIAPIGLAYTQGFGTPGQSVMPYFTLAGDAAVMYIHVPSNDLDHAWRVEPSAAAILGLAFSNRAFLEGGYRWTAKTNGLDFSGATVDVGVRF